MDTTSVKKMPEPGNRDTYINGSSIDGFFTDSVVLITGATGFLGKALLEKLLRCCPNLAVVFILIRPKRDQAVEQRCKRLLENCIFDEIRSRDPTILDKVYAVTGDVSLSNLGLSTVDRNMLIEKVNIVFHSAATVKFDEPLKVAINMNTKGTDRMIELCKDMKNLISIVHVSTAYSNADRNNIQEMVYATKVKPSTMIDMCESLDQETLDILEKKILNDHPNTYTFTKNLAEQVIHTKGKDLPLAIVRPSIICAAEQEPFPGWVDCLHGLTGVVLEISRGTAKTILANSNLMVDMVPVDYVVDTLISASWHSTMQQNNMLKIYNCTSNAKPIRWGAFIDYVRIHSCNSPTKYMLWYPSYSIRTNKFIHNFESYLFHIFPAFIGDIILRLFGNEPRMMKSIKRFVHILNVGKFFTTHEWNFHRDNMNDLAKKLRGLKDSGNFKVDMRNLNWEAYMLRYVMGIKKYVLKENPESSSAVRSRMLFLYCVHRLTQIFSLIILLLVILRIGH